jgi:hypothetical protein
MGIESTSNMLQFSPTFKRDGTGSLIVIKKSLPHHFFFFGILRTAPTKTDLDKEIAKVRKNIIFAKKNYSQQAM